MTREQASDLLDNLIGMIEDNHNADYDTALKLGRDALRQETCKDAISRKDAEALFRNARNELMKSDRKEHIKDFNTRDLMLLNAEQMIHLMPSVSPARPKGEWIIIDDCELFMAKCSECGEIVDSRMISKYPFCHCGADMRGNNNEHDN